LTETGEYRLILELPEPPTKRTRVKLKGRLTMQDGVASEIR
jgi:hypothetical protein